MLNLFQHPCLRPSYVIEFAMDKQPCVYILASRPRGTLYVGVTSDLIGRLYRHREGTLPGFTSRYGVSRLVRVELLGDMASAIAREKQLKRWHRQWKINLIEQDNPHWIDLAIDLGFAPLPQKRGEAGP
jgi:putative endonuclease